MIRSRLRARAGFTVMEAVVVTLLIGIIAAVAYPQYRRTVETGKANEAAGKADAFGHALRMYVVDRGGWVTGTISQSCNTTGACGGGGACDIIRCRLIEPENWDGQLYIYDLCPQGVAACAVNNPARVIARARRKTAANCPGCPNATNTRPFSAWAYDARANGTVTPVGGAPEIP